MLTYSDLVTLDRSLRDDRVLTVYLAGAGNDPAMQNAWAVRLDHALDPVRERVRHGSRDDQEQFAHAERRLGAELEARPPVFGDSGWVAFVTALGVADASAIDARITDFATWKTGACVVPYFAAIQQWPSAVVALVDARRAVVYHLENGVLDRGEVFHASHAVGPVSHMGDSPATGFHGGTRGTTGHDAAQRSLREGTTRMLRLAVDRMLEVAGEAEPIVLGGIARVVAHAKELCAPVADRLVISRALDVHASATEIGDIARRSATSWRELRLAKLLDDVVEAAGGGLLGTLGANDTRKALHEHAVNELFLSEHYASHHVIHAEGAAQLALDQGARVEILGGTAGATLDAHGGIGARLRFRPGETPYARIDEGARTATTRERAVSVPSA